MTMDHFPYLAELMIQSWHWQQYRCFLFHNHHIRRQKYIKILKESIVNIPEDLTYFIDALRIAFGEESVCKAFEVFYNLYFN